MNILTKFPNIKGRQKTALQALTVYYILNDNNFDINIIRISSIFDDNIRDIYSNVSVIKKLFEGTAWERYTTLNIGVKCDFEVSDKLQRKINIVKRHMKDIISDPLTTKEHTGIIYYLKKNILKEYITYESLAKNCDLSTTTIRNSFLFFDNFYKKNPTLKSQL